MSYDSETRAALYEMAARNARVDMLAFMQWCWWMPPTMPLIIGRHTKAVCDRITRAVNDFRQGKSTYLLVAIPFRHGKALEVNTPVLTTNGWKRHGELKCGDYVYGVDGKPKKILAVAPQIVDVNYTVRFSDGNIISAHPNHEWIVWDRRAKALVKKETKEIAKQYLEKGGRPRYLIEPHKHFDCDDIALPVSPYVLGVWLGDGRTTAPDICSSKQDIAVLEKCATLEAKTWDTVHKTTGVITWGFDIQKALRSVGLCSTSKHKERRIEKHIPDVYLTASKSQRLQLLAGLIDTDGYYDKKGDRFTFANTDKKLVSSFIGLINTFGWRSSIEIKKAGYTSSSGITSKKDTYYIRFVPDCVIPCVLSRKRNKECSRKRLRRVGIVECTIYPLLVESNCICVEGGMYCAGHGMIPTHNSDIVSRALPAFFLGRNADMEPSIIMSGYGDDLVSGFSKDCKNIMMSDAYQQLFPGVKPDPKDNSINSWRVKGSHKIVSVAGITGGITGKGGNLIVLDDYCKTRAQAESKNERDHVWNEFANSVFTRQDTPASIIIVCATPWHVDDIRGRILKAMKEDDKFPRFEELSFPARKEGPDGWDYLCPELHPPEWYDGNRAVLGPADAAALLDCNPVSKEGCMFRKEWFMTYDVHHKPNLKEMRRYIFVDTATAKKKDSDQTVMFVVGLGTDRNYYVLDCVADKLNLSERTDAIFRLVRKYEPSAVFWETIGAMADAEHVLLEMNIRNYRFNIIKLHQSVAKADRIRWLEPTFQNSRIWFPSKLFYRAVDGRERDLTHEFYENEFGVFPSCVHDDMLDCLANIHHPDVAGKLIFPHTKEWREATGGSSNHQTYTKSRRKSILGR